MIDSKQKKLTSAQIIEIAAMNTGVQRPINEIKQMLTIELNMANTWKMRNGNTIFVVHKSDQPGYGWFRALNADTAKNFLENSRVFADSAYKVGFDVVVTNFKDPTILNIFKVISKNPVRDGMGYVAQKTKNGYRVTLVLGPKRK